MGCGTICATSSGTNELALKSGQLLRILVTKVKPNGVLISREACSRFLKDIEMNSFRYILRGKDKIDKSEPVPPNIMEKWKVVLFSLDTDI